MEQLGTCYHLSGVALEGYDPVAYFVKHQAVKGRPAISFVYQELTWYFSESRHLNLFKAEPEKYIPQYGGYCAFGASNGYKAKPKMDAFTIYNDKLYLNFAKYVQVRWEEDKETKISAADKQWSDTKNTIPIKANRHFIYWKYLFLKVFGKDLFA